MATVTAPILLDSTGQQIVSKLQSIAENVKPTADEIKRTSSNNQTVEAELVSLNSKIVNIGTQTTDQTGTVSVPSGVRTKIAEKTLPAGRYIVIRGIDWGQNATGRRTINRSDSSARHNYITQMAVTGDDTVMQMITTESFDTDTTLEIWGLQDSGSALTAYPYWYIMRIK